ncbi:hypothetical protein GEOBRER4_n1490 [Citrifermentans bremense]|uniref:Ysc84 actin-binding domain-containing protein n=1 Tax=Citrifermentans bremense TaxID=60035 RepID=A0A6S6LXF3_9BACT|nr:hypothetical protein [Citrifermentans bremense]BCG46682.1 hypothetical protein GEOBRER4_n1490 [Citrifermentans bremense]
MLKGGSRIVKNGLLFLILVLFTGCATSRISGVDMATRDVAAIERISSNRGLSELSDIEGVALLSLVNGGMGGFGATGWSASVFVKDPVKKEFGPPSFLNAAGVTVGLGYLGVNNADCLLLFRKREDAVGFAKKSINFNFSNEASFLVWGRKQMTISDAESFSDGAGLSFGLIGLELLLGWRRDSLHEEMYQQGATVDTILSGEVAIPDELKPALAKLNLLMKKAQTIQNATGVSDHLAL